LKEKEENGRFPLHRRKSTLSLTSVPDPELDAKTHPQGQSIFFAKLPIEIRKMIYELVMGEEETVHLTLAVKKKFGHFLCDENQAADEECGCRVLVGGREGRRLDRSMLAMLKSCRRLYSEAIVDLYRPHTFSLLHITHLLYLPSRLPGPRLDQIRTIRLRWAIRALPFLKRPVSPKRYAYPEDTANWIQGWKTLANMKGLRELYVLLTDPSPQHLWERQWADLEERLLEDVQNVRQTRWFTLMLPYPGCRTDWDMGGCNVILRKPEDDDEDEDDEST
jgi:hypothetical protein